MRPAHPIPTHAMRLAACVAMALGLCVASLAASGRGEGKVTVRATVLKRASVKVLSQPASITITAADIARGFVDATDAAQVLIQCNSPSGYLLEFGTEGDFLRRVIEKNSGSNALTIGSFGDIGLRSCAKGPSESMLQLQFRFLLTDRAVPGIYAWPLRVSLTPL